MAEANFRTIGFEQLTIADFFPSPRQSHTVDPSPPPGPGLGRPPGLTRPSHTVDPSPGQERGGLGPSPGQERAGLGPSPGPGGGGLGPGPYPGGGGIGPGVGLGGPSQLESRGGPQQPVPVPRAAVGLFASSPRGGMRHKWWAPSFSSVALEVRSAYKKYEYTCTYK